MGWTPYHYVHQNPINLIDPTGMKGEDHYFNEHGKYLYSDTRTTDKIRVISNNDFNSIFAKYSKEMRNRKSSYFNLLNALDVKSRIVTVENSGSKFSTMWSSSIKNKKERVGYFVLNFEEAKLSFELSNIKPNATSNSAPLEYRAGEVHSSGGIVLGSAHTHPTEHENLGKIAAVNDMIITDQTNFDNQYSTSGADGNNARNVGSIYTISRDNVDYYSPKGKKSSINNITTRKKLESNNFNINRDALFRFNNL